MTDDDRRPARASNFGSPHRLRGVATAIVPRELSNGGMVLSHGIQILEPTVLDSYGRRRMITSREHAAGSELARLAFRAIRMPSVTMTYGDRVGSGGSYDDGAHRLDLRHRLWNLLADAGLAQRARTEAPLAVKCRRSDGAADVDAPIRLNAAGHLVLSVCHFDERAGGTRRLAQLRAGLGALADVLGIPDASVEPVSRIKRWSDPDQSMEGVVEDDPAWHLKQNERRLARRRAKLGLED